MSRVVKTFRILAMVELTRALLPIDPMLAYSRRALVLLNQSPSSFSLFSCSRLGGNDCFACAIRFSNSGLPTASCSASSSDSAVFSLIRFSMYSGTVILENGEIVRVDRSARNQRPQITQSLSAGSRFNCSLISLSALARSSLSESMTESRTPLHQKPSVLRQGQILRGGPCGTNASCAKLPLPVLYNEGIAGRTIRLEAFRLKK